MPQPITAIYENGLLHPITPLNLPNQTYVQIVVQPIEAGDDITPTFPDQGLYQEFIDLIALGTTPQAIINFRPSERAKERVAELIFQEKTSGLTADETAELNHYFQLEHIMRLAKARARYHLAQT